MKMEDTSICENDNLRSNSKGSTPFEKNTGIEEFTQIGFQMLMETTKKSNKMPSGRIRDLYESFSDFITIMKNQENSIISILAMLIKHCKYKENFQKMDDEDKFEMIIDANDTLLENVGISLDELSGIKRNPETRFIEKKWNVPNGSWNNKTNMAHNNATHILNTILNNTKNLEKPQLHFEDKINNDPSIPFEPKINYKYNMLKPLSIIAEETENDICQFSHPYEFELLKFKPPKEMLKVRTPIPFKMLENTPLHLVRTSEDVEIMMKDLEKHTEISVDLEHHSYRSFQGFTCLMQISTRDTDYIIDSISLRSKLQILNKIFTDPSIVKVFHGANLDILWLQKDLGLYVVNMFDTHQAAKLLNFPKLSLAYLLSYYCQVNAQKHLQLADWRIRPLPEELIIYAREDTHYLLFIYDNMRNSLIEKGHGQTNLLESVIFESTTICLKKYVKPLYEKEGYLDIYQKSKKLFDNRQKFALEHLFEWRDKIARESDESYAYVLPNHMMLNISEVLPREAQGILACCNPIPVPIRQNLLQLHQIILKAREQPLIKPVLEEQNLYRFTSAQTSVDNPLQCPHDLIHEGEFRDDLPILFAPDKEFSQMNFLIKKKVLLKPNVDVFENPIQFVKINTSESSGIHSSPYQRYKLAKKFLEFSANKNLIKSEVHANEKTTKEIMPIQISNSSLKSSGKNELFSDFDKYNPSSLSLQYEKNLKQHDNEKTLEKNRSELEEDNLAPPKKKLKKENCKTISDYAFESKSVKKSADPEDGQLKRPVKRKKIKLSLHDGINKSNKKKNQHFDYDSIDFNKYCSKTNLDMQKHDKQRKKKKKKVKKNFKISI